MPIDSKFYTHPSDRAALGALKAIPGFHQLMKAFMGAWNEKLLRVENMSSYLRINERQMKKYYDMLPPICDRLGIDIPDLYVKLDVEPNAYTYGDTKPFIVIHSGLLERFPDELIETVIAHECGHIACHHTLYTTMGNMLLNGAAYLASGFAVGSLITESLLTAFYYWMRCSEFSADRAAMICGDGPEKIARMCMYFAGYNPDFSDEADLDAFMEQAKDYREMMSDSKVNKLMEFYLYRLNNHPLNSVRAYEAKQWAETENARNIFDYLDNGKVEAIGSILIPVPESSKKMVGKDYKVVCSMFEEAGFTNVSVFETPTNDRFKKSGTVLEVNLNGNTAFGDDEWFPANSFVSIRYKA